MRYIKTGALAGIAGACLIAMAAPAAAQSLGDDARCMVLSNAFARQANDAQGRQLAAASLSFYMGRLDGKADAKAIADAVRQVGAHIDAKAAGAQMSQCANRMGHAEQAIQVAVRAEAPHK